MASKTNKKMILAEFEGKKEIDGVKKKYWIQKLTEELVEDAMIHMLEGFVKEEPLCRYTKISSCEESMKEMKRIYYLIMKQGLALVCLTEGYEGTSQIAGINATYKTTRKSCKFNLIGGKWDRFSKNMEFVMNYNDAFEKLQTDEYLSAMGLFVLPGFRGEGIGEHLLKAREPLCGSVGLKHSCTIFTSIFSQRIAEDVGFKDVTVLSFDELAEMDPTLYIPNISEYTKNVRFMYISY